MKSQIHTVRRRIVIINADDFGASTQTNKAIIDAFGRGLITSATIMANMPAFEEACQLARELGLRDCIGLHLNLTLGRPLTPDIAACTGFCDAEGFWRPLRKVASLNRREAPALEGEIAAQIMACTRQGITPTHLDSHQHIHNQFGIATVVIRMAKRLGIPAIRIARNCGPVREDSSSARRAVVAVYRKVRNARLRFHGLACTQYFGDALDTTSVLRISGADVEVMVHPRLDSRGSLVDLDGEDLESRISALGISRAEMCSYSSAGQIPPSTISIQRYN